MGTAVRWAPRLRRSGRPRVVEPGRELDIDVLDAPPPPAPEERIRPRDPPRMPARPSPTTRSPPSRPTRSGPTAPAEAGAIVAQQPNADSPVDLTGETFVTGTARASAPSHASAVSLADQTWSCPWPREADAEQIDRQAVVIRVIVTAGGEVEAAKVLSDPGHGFGAAAACALRYPVCPGA